MKLLLPGRSQNQRVLYTEGLKVQVEAEVEQANVQEVVGRYEIPEKWLELAQI